MDLDHLDKLLEDALSGFEPPTRSAATSRPEASRPEASTPESSSSKVGSQAKPSLRGFKPLPSRNQKSTTSGIGQGSSSSAIKNAANLHQPGTNDHSTPVQPPQDEPDDVDNAIQQMANMLQEFAQASNPGSTSLLYQAETSRQPEGKRPADFRSTLEQMSRATAQAVTAGTDIPADEGPDQMAEMLNQMMGAMQSALSGDNEGGDPGEGATDALTVGIMKQVLSKQVLYPTLVDIRDEYPIFFDRHQMGLSAEDKIRFTKQSSIVTQICEHYEEKGDDGYDELLELLQEMQALGKPPDEIVQTLENRDVPRDIPGPGDGGCPLQ